MKEYEYLTEHVTMWNVAVERQIQVKGPDAEKFVDMVITRRASSCDVMKARYVILCNQYGGILNDPVMFVASGERRVLVFAVRFRFGILVARRQHLRQNGC